MKNATKGKLIRWSAIALDVGAPLGVTLSQFPIWVDKSSEATISGLFLVFACLSCIPFIKQIWAWLKSPSIPVLWLVFLVLLAVLRNIIDQMFMVCLVGTIANTIGALLYKLGKKVENKPDVASQSNTTNTPNTNP